MLFLFARGRSEYLGKPAQRSRRTHVQAQTVANFYLAFDLELAIVPVLNKIDLPAADPEKVAEQVQQVRTLYCGAADAAR